MSGFVSVGEAGIGGRGLSSCEADGGGRRPMAPMFRSPFSIFVVHNEMLGAMAIISSHIPSHAHTQTVATMGSDLVS